MLITMDNWMLKIPVSMVDFDGFWIRKSDVMHDLRMIKSFKICWEHFEWLQVYKGDLEI